MAPSVTEILQDLRRTFGEAYFRMLFRVIAAGRGSEFADPVRTETDPKTGAVQCRAFYCDPMNNNQKSNCERNHELIRYIIPKNQVKKHYTEEEIREMMDHISPYPRRK